MSCPVRLLRPPLLRPACLTCLGDGHRHRSRSALHWAEQRRRETGPAQALRHFDHFYPEHYGVARWRSVRLALLSRAKPTALVNHFGDVAGVCAQLEEAGAFDLMAKARTLADRQRDRLKTAGVTPPDALGHEHSDVHETTAESSESSTAVEDGTISQQQAEAAGRLRIIQPDSADVAALHDYVPASELHGDDDWLEEGDYFQGLRQAADGSLTVALDPEPCLNIPEPLRLYSFPAGDISTFRRPRATPTGPRDLLPLDGASLLPVLALDVQAGDNVLDMCAAPGGKALAVLQTLRPAALACADTQTGRLRRLQQLLVDYLPGAQQDWPCRVTVSRQDGRNTPHRDAFDRVLVDVPCFGDRHSLVEEENNIFSISRSRERIQLPQLQTLLLRKALEAVRPGGTVVYSTCTLSPVQNDGVVYMALKQLWEDTDIQVVVKDLTKAMHPFYGAVWFARDCGVRYGQQVLPSVVNNFGPMYFAKIVRIK